MLHGHGGRARQARGPHDPSGPPEIAGFVARRYRCQRCGVVIAVVAAETLRRRLFTGAAIALALALFGVEKRPAAQIRKRISPWQIVGATAATGWATLRRWARVAGAGSLWACVRPCPPGWCGRELASRASTTVAAHALPSSIAAAITDSAFAGAMRAS